MFITDDTQWYLSGTAVEDIHPPAFRGSLNTGIALARHQSSSFEQAKFIADRWKFA